MRNHPWMRFMIAIIAVWLLPFTAHAGLQQLFEGEHYRVVRCPDQTSKTCVRLINLRVQVEADALAERFGMDQFELRAKNPMATLAVCRDATRRAVWHMAQTRGIQDRPSNVIWNGCPQEDRRVVTIPGEILDVDSSTRVLPYLDVETAIQSVMRCDPSNATCIKDALAPILPNGIPVSETVEVKRKTPPKPSERAPETPSPSMTAKALVQETIPMTVISSTKSEQRPVHRSESSFVVLVACIVSLGLMVSLIYAMKLRRQLADEKTVNLKKEDDLQDREKELGVSRDACQTLRIELDRVRQEFEIMRANLDSANADLIRVREKLAPATESIDDLIRSVEDGEVERVSAHIQEMYGLEEYSKSRADAWRQLSDLSERASEGIHALHLLVKDSAGEMKGSDHSYFVRLNSFERDIRFCVDLLHAELATRGQRDSDRLDLRASIIELIALNGALRDDLRKAKEEADVYRSGMIQAQSEAGALRQRITETTDETSPPKTILGLSPPPELPSASRVATLRVVGGSSNDDGPKHGGDPKGSPS